jgi:amino acid transporter
VILARILYGMASHRVLPPGLGNINPRYSTPVIASVLVGLVFIAIIWVYLLSSPVASVFTDLINVTGILYASFYGLTALSAIVYYRRRAFSDAFDAVVIGILPFAAAGFLTWIIVKTVQAAPAAQLWTLGGIAAAGVLLMLTARFVMRSSFFQIPRESASRES